MVGSYLTQGHPKSRSWLELYLGLSRHKDKVLVGFKLLKSHLWITFVLHTMSIEVIHLLKFSDSLPYVPCSRCIKDIKIENAKQFKPIPISYKLIQRWMFFNTNAIQYLTLHIIVKNQLNPLTLLTLFFCGLI